MGTRVIPIRSEFENASSIEDDVGVMERILVRAGFVQYRDLGANCAAAGRCHCRQSNHAPGAGTAFAAARACTACAGSAGASPFHRYIGWDNSNHHRSICHHYGRA
jgi:hypothetical protein